jgi:hypothetical protein
VQAGFRIHNQWRLAFCGYIMLKDGIEEERSMALKVGDLAPDFELPAVEGEQRLKIKLSDFRGKKHVLVTFHPLNWTPT